MNNINVTVFTIKIQESHVTNYLYYAIESNVRDKSLIFLEECAKLLGATFYVKSEVLIVSNTTNERSFQTYEHLRSDMFRRTKPPINFNENWIEIRDAEWEKWINKTDELWEKISKE